LKKAILTGVWKDSALALYKTLLNPEFEISCLLTSVNQQFQRISMHGVQNYWKNKTKSIGLPLEIMQFPKCRRWNMKA
jgi:diphthamide synthase (EF-2-diphthine--ammonia ligase)